MSGYLFDIYDMFIGKSIIVIYECGHIYNTLNCTLLEYCKKNPKESFIKLKVSNNTIYNINCDKIIYFIAEYSDMLTQNMIANESTYSNHAYTIGDNISFKTQQNEETRAQDLESHSHTPNISIMSNDRETTSHTLPRIELNSNDIIADTKHTHTFNKSIDYYSKHNNTPSSLATFINNNFQGVHLTIYTTSTKTISGEVAFNYDYLIVLKSDENTYYINPNEISYFF